MAITANRRATAADGTVSLFQDQVFKPGFIDLSATDGLTAGATQTIAGGTALIYQLNRFTTVTSSGDAATLPLAKQGRWRVVTNVSGSNAMAIFPANATDQINAVTAGSSYSLSDTKTVIFFCMVDGIWNTVLTA